MAALAVAVRHSRRWLAGAGAEVDLFAGLKALPRRYLVDVHDVVGRRPFNARFHTLTAGGFLASLALLVLTVVPWFRGPVLWGVAAVALGLMLAGALMVGWRRLVVRPRELSGGNFARLPISLIAYAAGLLVVGA